MAPFVHASTDRPIRFSVGSYGLLYAGDRFEVALMETIYHHERAMAASREEPGWTSQFREITLEVQATAYDLRGIAGAGQAHPSRGWRGRRASQPVLYRRRCNRGVLPRSRPSADPGPSSGLLLGWRPGRVCAGCVGRSGLRDPLSGSVSAHSSSRMALSGPCLGSMRATRTACLR